jgi:hypothetical protein
MNHSLIKRIALVSLSGFFLAICAVAFHYQDNKFLRTSRFICKVKTSPSGTMSKNQVDSAVVYPLLTAVVHENTTIFIPSQVAHTFPNKAPPARS